MPTRFLLFLYANTDLLESLKDFLPERGYNVYLNPRKNEIKKFVEFKNRTVILRPAIFYHQPKGQHFATVEKIIVDLYMETKKINLMDIEEYRRIVANIILGYRINMASMLDYAYGRKLKNRIQDIILKIIESTNATF